MSDADDLHERLFGWRPAKSGTAYERLAALVMARLGWTDVQHDLIERRKGRLAEHQIDVQATHPSGEVQRMIVECKDWAETVGKETLDTLVGVRDQLEVEADAAAVVTTVGFKEGARRVAADEDIAMILLCPPREEDEGRFIKRVELVFDYFFPRLTAADVKLREDHGLPSGSNLRFAVDGDTRLRHLNGRPAELFEDLFKTHSTPMADGEGDFHHAVDFPDGRLLRATDGADLPISELSWTEEVTKVKNRQVIEREGDPCLVLEQLDSDGEPFSGRMLVDKDLYAWDIAGDGAVSRRGDIAPGY